MMVRRRSRLPTAQSVDTDVVTALEAMTAPELRTFVRGVLDEFGDAQRARVIESLIARAARGDAGWKPHRRWSRALDDAGRSLTRHDILGTPTRAT